MVYARVNETDRWYEARVRDLATDEILQDIIAADDETGWYERYMRLDGELVRDGEDKLITECVRGQQLCIEYPPAHVREGDALCPCGVVANEEHHDPMPFGDEGA